MNKNTCAMVLSVLGGLVLISFQNCGSNAKDPSTASTQASSSVPITTPGAPPDSGNSTLVNPDPSNLGAGNTVSSTVGITKGQIPDGYPIDCNSFNPDAIKSLSSDTIIWLASLQPSGLTLHENYLVARQQGYTGAFGNGEHNAWLAQDPNRQTAFTNAVNAMANAPAPPWANWAAHNADRRAKGYYGLFLCGGDICFQQNQCDNLGRRN